MAFTPEERQRAIDYLLRQTNAEIGSFLDQFELARSGTKTELRERIVAAIDARSIRYADIVRFLDTLAPWGKQHVYILTGAPDAHVTNWRDTTWVDAHLADKVEQNVRAQPLPLILPRQLRLSSVSHSPSRLRVIAVARRDEWVRDEDLDQESQTDEGDRVELRAFVNRVRRGLVTFDWDLVANRAFVQVTQLPSHEKYEDARDAIAAIMRPWLDINLFGQLNLRPAIAVLHEQEETNPATAEARYHAVDYISRGGRRIAARSGTPQGSLLGEADIDNALRATRRAGAGEVGNFYWKARPESPVTEEVHVFLVANAGRVNFSTSNPEPVVRYVLERIRAHC